MILNRHLFPQHVAYTYRALSRRGSRTCSSRGGVTRRRNTKATAQQSHHGRQQNGTGTGRHHRRREAVTCAFSEKRSAHQATEARQRASHASCKK